MKFKRLIVLSSLLLVLFVGIGITTANENTAMNIVELNAEVNSIDNFKVIAFDIETTDDKGYDGEIIIDSTEYDNYQYVEGEQNVTEINNNLNDNFNLLSVKNDDNNLENESFEHILSQGNEIQTYKIVTINSTGKGVVPLNITDGLMNKEVTGEFSATLIYEEGNNDKTIPLNVLYEENGLKFDYPLPDYIPSATLVLVYTENGNNAYKNITLKRIFNAKIEVINNVNEYQSGYFTFKVTDIDNNNPISGQKLSLYTVGNIRAGFSATTDENGIATFKTSHLYEFDNTNNSFTMKQLEVGNHPVELSMAGQVIASKVTTNLTINKLTINIVLNPYKEYYSSEEKVVINVTNANSGEAMSGVILHLNMPATTYKNYYFQTDVNGTAQINVSGLMPNEYKITVSNNDTKNINNKSVDGSIKILGRPVKLTLNVPSIYYCSDANIATINVTDMFTGEAIPNAIVLVQVNHDNSSQDFLYQTNDEGVINFNNISTSFGLYEIAVNLADKRYSASAVKKTVNIKKSIEVEVSDINFSQEAIIKINVANEFLNSDIFISITNEKGFEKNYHEKAKETIILKLNDLEPSSYSVNVDCINNDNFQIHVNKSFNVSKLDIGDINLPKELFLDESFSFWLPSDATGFVSLYLGGYNYADVGIIEGEVSFSVEDLTEGDYSCRIYYSGDDKYNSFSKESIINILGPVFTISAKDMKVKYGGDYDFIAIFYNSNLDPLSNSNVIFNVNNKDYLVKTDYSGIGVLNVGLGNGTYRIKSINLLTGEYLINTLTIYGEPKHILNTTIEVFGLTTVFNGGKYIVATLKDSLKNPINGVYVTIDIGSVSKSIKTDKNGQVKLSTNGLVPKKFYTATITFGGNDDYEKSTTAVKVTVKKATPKITAKTKTFKKSVKIKKYTITLKNNLNKGMKNTKVTIKVNKKTFTAKTNSKGVATFKINNLNKKGTFKSVITYKGNTYYNKVTKNVNIKVK